MTSSTARDLSQLTWIEIDSGALSENIRALRSIVGTKVLLAPSVKANAYGHGLLIAARAFISGGADWLCVNSLFEGLALRADGVDLPIYIKGYVPAEDCPEVVANDLRIVVYNWETVKALSAAAQLQKKTAQVHLKVETGNNRQGIAIADLIDFATKARAMHGIHLEGLSTHFADLEDSDKQDYARFQLKNFVAALKALANAGIQIPIPHCANSAATLLMPETHFALVRPGISAYGMWPSELIKKLVMQKRSVKLKPALAWKTKIAQIKTVPKDSSIGYGCTFKTARESKIAILPVGYYDGYDRGLSNKAEVLIQGKSAAVRGRICMNITMVDVTDIPEAKLEDEVVLLGRQGNEFISAEELAAWADTINYEITTRIRESIRHQ